MAVTSAAPPTQAETTGNVASLRWFVFALFFIFGGITSLNDVLIPKLKHLFQLRYAEVMLVQSAFFAAYFIVSLPAARIVQAIGWLRTAVVGLLTMTAGCLLFIPASASSAFPAFLGALFVLAAGITIVQVVANPLISLLGEPASAPSRLTFAQAFNSLGTTIFPYVGAILILGSLAAVDDSRLTGAALAAFRTQETRVITHAYLGIAVALAVVAGVVWLGRNRLRETRGAAPSLLRSFELLKRPRFAFGAFGIFVYVGAEVTVASLLTNYLMQPDTLALPQQTAGEMLAFYWGGAMIGRFLGAAAMQTIAPHRALAGVAFAAMALLALSAFTVGHVSGVALILIGLCNAIMFPTIFSLASEGLGDRAAEGSGLICMAIVGGAIVPLIAGGVADAATLRTALMVPAACYATIAAFAWFCGTPAGRDRRVTAAITSRARAALLAFLALVAAPLSAAPIDDVDPLIGTGGEGHTYPGAVAPFGMVQLSPDTDTSHQIRDSYRWAAGYRHSDPTIQGFSHTHFSGAGHSDLGDILVMPVAGDAVPLEPGDAVKPGSGYRSRFSHETEVARPGYYGVTLADAGVRAEMTAGTRIGVHRYTFPAGKAAHLVVDLRTSLYDYPGKILWSSVRLMADGTITGMRQTRGWAPDRMLFFAVRFSAPLTGHAFVSTEANVAYTGFQGPARGSDAVAELAGKALVARLDFGALDRPLEVRVAISSVDQAGAIANLDSEPGDFDAVRAATQAAWGKALGTVAIEAPAAMRRNVYTALYHTLLAPSVAGDADGRYRGPDNQVHKAEGFTFRSTFSLWDTFRAEHPLLTLVQPETTNSDIVRSLLASQQASPDGILPVWQYQGYETWTMIGYHAVPVIADAYLKGIGGFDAEAALRAMVASATYGPYGGLADYMKLGYVPIDREPEAASKTVEYAYDDWTIARMAAALGHADIAATFNKRAQYWRNGFDRKTRFVRARKSDGSFRTPFDPTAINYGSDYTEGNAWQYSWFAPHDQLGLVGLMGGDKATVAKLDAMFDFDNSKVDYSHAEDIAGLIGQYIHGNEPSHHVAYLYDYAGAPWRTQARLKQIVESQYKPTPDGLAGNDDLGQMSAWLVFTALGFYPVTPGSLEYVIGRPFVDRAAINLPNGKRFTMVAEGLDDAHPYIGRVLLNGAPLPRSFIRHGEIMAGGELRFVMAATPKTRWATARADRPFSMTR